MNKEQQIKEMTQDFINLGITTRQGVELFAEILYNAGYRKIDENCAVITKAELKKYKTQAVKEFAEKLKDSVADYLYKMIDEGKDNVVGMFELREIVDNTIKEYEQ